MFLVIVASRYRRVALVVHCGEIWKDEPMPGARATADRYVEIATADGKEALATLFAPDAVFHAPDGSVYSAGRRSLPSTGATSPMSYQPSTSDRAVTDGSDCWVELADGSLDDPTFLASNHFTVGDDGFITRLIVFLRPRPAT